LLAALFLIASAAPASVLEWYLKLARVKR